MVFSENNNIKVKKLFIIDSISSANKRGRPFLLNDAAKEVFLLRSCMESDPLSFREDCLRLRDEYELNVWHIRFEDMTFKKGTYSVAILSIPALFDTLLKKKYNKCERIKLELQKSNPDMWLIKYIAWNESPFYFVWQNSRIIPEMGLFLFLQETPERELLITGTCTLIMDKNQSN